VPFEALGSHATFDRVLYDGAKFGHAGEVQVGSEEEMDFLGIPRLLEADQVRDLLQPGTASERVGEHPRGGGREAPRAGDPRAARGDAS